VRARKIVPALLVVAGLATAGCGGSSDTSNSATAASSGAGGGPKLSLIGYSTPQVVYDEVIPAFEKTSAGKGVSFTTSFGPSGDQSRAVEAGQKADVVTFSLEPDLDRLIKDKLVAPAAANTWVTTSSSRASRSSRRTRSRRARRSGTCSRPTAPRASATCASC